MGRSTSQRGPCRDRRPRPATQRRQLSTLPRRVDAGGAGKRDDDASLLVGPLLRYADETCATIWVETDRPVLVDGRRRRRPSPRRRGASTATTTRSSASTTWRRARRTSTGRARRPPSGRPPDSAFPPSVIRAIDPDAPVPPRLRELPALGSARRGAPRDARRRRPRRAGRPDGGRRPRHVARRPAAASATRCTPTSPPTRSSTRLRAADRDDATPRSPTRSRTSRSTRGCTTRRGRRPPSVGCCRPSRPACCSTTTTSATTGTRRCRGGGR